MQVKHHLLNVSVTIGGAFDPDHGTEDEKLLKHANLALTEALQQQCSVSNVRAIHGWESIGSSRFGEPFALCTEKK